MNQSISPPTNNLLSQVNFNLTYNTSQVINLNSLIRNTLYAMVIDNTLRKMESRLVYDFNILNLLFQELQKSIESLKFNDTKINLNGIHDTPSKKIKNDGTGESLFKSSEQNFRKRCNNFRQMLENIKIAFPEFERQKIGN